MKRLLTLLVPAVMAVLASAAPAATRVSITVTSRNLRHALTPMPSRPFGRVKLGIRSITVNDAVRYQRIIGFGAAMTDTSAWLLDTQLSPPQRRRVLLALFGPNGIHVDYVRVPIAASDYTADGQPYSYDDMPPGQTDPTLAHFSIAHDETYILPILRAMLSLRAGTDILATPWSAPPWMKANDAFDNLNESGTLEPQYYPAFAAYFVKFIQAYLAAHVPVTAITPMNEAGTASEYPGTKLDEWTFITSYLVPALEAADLHTLIYGLDGSGWDPQDLLSIPPGDMAGVAWHGYGGLLQMSVLHADMPTASIIMSELSPGHTRLPTIETVISSMRNYAQAVDLWNLALDPNGGPKQAAPGCTGCTALVTVNESAHAASLRLSYYQLGQVSKFIQRDARRIQSSRWVSDYVTGGFIQPTDYGVTPGLDNVAVENPDGSKVLVVYDNASKPVRFQIVWRHQGLHYRLAPHETATFVWR